MTRRNSKRACGWACAFWSSKTTWWPRATPCNSRPPTIRLPGCGTGARYSTSCTGKRSEEHTSELQSRLHLVCRLLLEKKKKMRRIGVLGAETRTVVRRRDTDEDL